MSRHGLSKSQESAVAHRERGKQDEGHDTQPDPPSTAHHSSMYLFQGISLPQDSCKVDCSVKAYCYATPEKPYSQICRSNQPTRLFPLVLLVKSLYNLLQIVPLLYANRRS